MKKLRAIIIGCGGRGNTYSREMDKLPEKFEVVGIAEPLKERREEIQKRHGLPDSRCFTDYAPLFDLGKIADFAVISIELISVIGRSSKAFSSFKSITI